MSAELSKVVEAIVVEPGDTLIVRVTPGTSQAEAERLKAMLYERLPGAADVVVVAAEQLAAFRPYRIKLVGADPLEGMTDE